MTTTIIPNLQNFYNQSQQKQDNHFCDCTLQWRRGQLLVKPSGQVKQPYLPSLHNQPLLVECLKHSPVNLVSIDPKLGESSLRFWADACEQAHKPIFLRIPPGNKLPKQSSQSLRWLQRLIDWMIALVLLLIISPVMLILVMLIQSDSPESLFSCEWHVGQRGKLFRAIKFCTTKKYKLTPLGSWMCKYGVDNLPQLFNVLRGEMGLLGSRCWTLEDAVQLSLKEQRQLNNLPGITASWEVETQPKLLHLDSSTL
ncbi:heterocyst development glycosyltransferase HepC [Nostoc sp. UHCC 0302]|uniref:heterocyst development glycosyltransferase HepC n=1 Tax=Nostoc sp. UHCC 0302 TaxID=3134896 RepID=UPI00311CC2E1